MALEAGQLSLTLQFAQGLKDKDLFGKQDPYALITVGNQSFRSKTHTGNGTNLGMCCCYVIQLCLLQ